MRKSNWPPEKTEVLRTLVDEGLCRRAIAERMGLIVNAVTTKLYTMGLAVPLGPAEPPEPREDTALPHLAGRPQYADITPEEAAAVRRGAVPSAPLPRLNTSSDRSLTGSTAALCTL